MKFRVSVVEYGSNGTPRHRDVSLTVDATATVGETARALVRGGAGHPSLLPYATHRQAPFTLRATFPDHTALILDQADPVASSGLASGTSIEPVFESSPGAGTVLRPPAASLTVLDGDQQGVRFLAVGQTTIGRDRGNRVELHDRSVSRQHATLRPVPGGVEIEDAGSANGIALLDQSGEPIPAGPVVRISGTETVEIGTVQVQIDTLPTPPSAATPVRDGAFLPSPVVDPVYQPAPLDLPVPADPPPPTRFPLIALLAPLVMGAVLFATTRSMLSIVFVALSPLIMLGTWLDSSLTRRKQARAGEQDFETNLTAARETLARDRPVEQAARDRETPLAGVMLAWPAARDARLWSRRPEHRAFLELRLGTAPLPSRKPVVLPMRGKIPADAWEQLTRLHEEYATIPDVPVLERLDRCGALGIAGLSLWAGNAARAVLTQLLALHSPAHVTVTGFATKAQADGDWAWLKWVPHVDSPYSPLLTAHLTADAHDAAVLLTALEGLIADRTTAGPSRGVVRSRMHGDAAEAKERLAPADPDLHQPSVVVLVLTDTIADRARLVGLAEDGADVGVHVIWVAADMTSIPAVCRTVIDAQQDAWRVHFVRQGVITHLTGLDGIEPPLMEGFARDLASIIDTGSRVLDETDLPRTVPFAHLVPGDILGDPDTILRTWQRTDSLTAAWTAGTERAPQQLTAVIGQGTAGPVEIDLRTHGPHALVGGTTGSGKSEFLQTWILSLAASHSPDRVTFLLVDYKGGAAFADCVDLPHTVGLVTDLTPHLVRRALTSLRAELRYRERLLADKGAKDLIALERRGDPDAPPVLVIVVDEFAALVGEFPEFVDGIIDVAQRGRSLGLHLILATQRPAGVIKDNLRANTNLRIALRMADAADSADVIGVRAGTADGPRDIQALASNIRAAAAQAGTAPPRKPWVDQLPTILPLAELPTGHTDGLPVGLIDQPDLQRQSPYTIDLAKVGNLVIYGGPGTGKTTTLVTLAASAVAADARTQIYGIDNAGGRLSILEHLPNTGAIIPSEDHSRLTRLLGILKTLITERATSESPEQRVLLLVDGFASFRDTYEHRGAGTDPFADLIEIATTGRNAGIHVALTSERATGLPSALASVIPERLTLPLPADTDYQTLGVPVGPLADAGPGRAVRIGGGEEVQLALPGEGPSPVDTDNALMSLAAALSEQAPPRPVTVPTIPGLIPLATLTPTVQAPAPFAIDTTTLEPVTAPHHGLALVTGPAGSGRTTAIRSLLTARADAAGRNGHRLDTILIAPRRAALHDQASWDSVADTPADRETLIRRLTTALGGQAPTLAGLSLLPLIGTEPTASEPIGDDTMVFPTPGTEGIVVIEDIGGFDGTGDEPALAGLLKLLRHANVTTIIEGENATIGTAWELASPLRGARWALALQPDQNDTPTIFTTPFTHTRRADNPPGRGLLLTHGHTTGIHIAIDTSKDAQGAGGRRQPSRQR